MAGGLKRSSLARRAVRGVAWSIGTSIGARLVGVIGTLILTRYLAPEVIGEVSVASVLVLTAGQLSNIGSGQYVVSKPYLTRAEVFHATFYHLVFGAIALIAVVALRRPLAPVFDAPGIVDYIPGLVAAAALDRLSFMPERILVREMEFATVGLGRTAAELAYTGVSVAFVALAGWGGEAIVLGSVVRSALRLVVFGARVEWRAWARPHPITRASSRAMFRFGLPISVGTSAGFASRRWDNLVFSSIFGPAQLGMYNLAYNLADIPSSQVGEHIGDVLLPSFAHMDDEMRKRALVRSTALLALLVFPLAVGLGAISDTLVAALFNDAWRGVAPYLTILAALSVVRPIGWTISSYLQARDMPRSIMVLELGKVVLLLACIAGLGTALGMYWACAGVGIAFGCHALAALSLVRLRDGISMRLLLGGLAGPLAACLPMAFAVLGVRQAIGTTGIETPVALLLVEIAAGTVAYVAAAFVLAPQTARDFLGLLAVGFTRAQTRR